MVALSKIRRRPHSTYWVKKRHFGIRASEIRKKLKYARIIVNIIQELDDAVEDIEDGEDEEEDYECLLLWFLRKWQQLEKWRDGPVDEIPKINLQIELLSEQQCLMDYHFTKEQLKDLYL